MTLLEQLLAERFPQTPALEAERIHHDPQWHSAARRATKAPASGEPDQDAWMRLRVLAQVSRPAHAQRTRRAS